MKKTVKIEIFSDGTIQAETKGIKGKKCMDYMKILEEILEAETVDSDHTPEYFEKENIQNRNIEKQKNQ
ncbi:DUF2997 domain-containing protein [Methanobacterium formicicum]|uniref:DUF2997 domain-containing protein n=1 Tax=Methanobacterium formicicum (strain DSM 3637 / PP1) TaxID=1204725 RepID=K2RQE1_METFP|nr:DUF2997 domain-containing protein [Methanobacterium formicicum]EKF84965.1 hypothetical protein A994_11227 [Methanobacterium formicicum DSM 3637]